MDERLEPDSAVFIDADDAGDFVAGFHRAVGDRNREVDRVDRIQGADLALVVERKISDLDHADAEIVRFRARHLPDELRLFRSARESGQRRGQSEGHRKECQLRGHRGSRFVG